MTREQKIKKGKIWQVWKTNMPDNPEFEGSKTAAFKFLKTNVSMKLWKTGKTEWHVGKLIWENE